MKIAHLLALAALTAAVAPAQEKAAAEKKPRGILQVKKDRARKSLSIEMHEAWLRETLDLDVKGAMQSYDKIQKTAPRTQPLRWLAVTRLAELHRFGIGAPEPSPTNSDNAPPAIKDALEQLREPLPVDELLRDPKADLKLGELHPATRLAQDWAREQIGPTLTARWLQRMARYRRGDSQSQSQYWWAVDVLSVEIRGRRTQADALRKLWFSEWKPRKIDGDLQKLTEDVRTRLKAWIDDKDISSRRRSRLRRLGEHFEKLITDDEQGDPKVALEFVARLPVFAERLIDGVVPKPDENSGNRRNR